MIKEMPEMTPEIHFFVCINDRRQFNSEKPSCGPFIDEKQVKEVKRWLVANGYAGRVFMTKTGCLGGCNSDGAVIATYPKGVFHKGFQSVEEIKEFVQEQLSQ